MKRAPRKVFMSLALAMILGFSALPTASATSLPGSGEITPNVVLVTQAKTLKKPKTNTLYFRKAPRGHQAEGGARLRVRGNQVAGSFCYKMSECVTIKGWGRVSKGKLRYKTFNYANRLVNQSIKASGKGKKLKLSGWKRVSKARYNKIFAW